MLGEGDLRAGGQFQLIVCWGTLVVEVSSPGRGLDPGIRGRIESVENRLLGVGTAAASPHAVKQVYDGLGVL